MAGVLIYSIENKLLTRGRDQWKSLETLHVFFFLSEFRKNCVHIFTVSDIFAARFLFRS